MRKPKIYKSEMLLEEFVKKNNTKSLIQYIHSLNNYIEYLESQCDFDENLEEENSLNEDLEEI